MTASWHKAVTETKRQYDAIDRALEVYKSFFIQSQKLNNFLNKYFRL